MNEIEFSQRLFLVEPNSPEAAGLARELVDEARYPAQFAVQHYLNSDDAAERIKAKNVIGDAREFAIAPLAASASSKDVDTETWILRTLTEETVNLRLTAASALKDLLTKRQAASPAPAGSSYQLPPRARICDLAYLLLHRMLHLEVSPAAYFGIPARERDAKIAEFEKSREYRYAFESKS